MAFKLCLQKTYITFSASRDIANKHFVLKEIVVAKATSSISTVLRMDHLFKFLFTRFLVFRLGYGVKCHKYENNFVLTYNEGIKYNTSVFQSHHVESVIACSVSCSMFFTCCSASYDESKKVCDLYSVCYPQLKTDAGFIHIKRAPSTGMSSFHLYTLTNYYMIIHVWRLFVQ